jgi:hypothetical protein
VIKGFE